MPAAIFPVRSRKHQSPMHHTDLKKKKANKNQQEGKKRRKRDAGAQENHEQAMSNHVWQERSFCPHKHHTADVRSNRQETKRE